MPFNKLPRPNEMQDWQSWGSALVFDLEQKTNNVPPNLIAITFQNIPLGWREYTATGMPTLPSGGKWIEKA